MMKFNNTTNIKDFVIVGFPGLAAEYYGIVSFLLLLVFLSIVFGNTFILVIIMSHRTLRKPTYVIFCYLAMTDLSFGLVTLPKIIGRYWWNDTTSLFGLCFTQMYFVHSLGAIHSLILLIMALDRFVAILLPFRYSLWVTNKTVSIACIVTVVVTFIRMVGIALHALSLPYCDQNTIAHCYCDHISITQLGCGDNVSYVKLVSLGTAMFTLLFPLTFIIISYFSIIVAVLKMSHTEGGHKVMSTCAPQIFVTCLYYVPRCYVYLVHSLGLRLSADLRIIITMMYSLIPPAVNPLIYCLKTKDIKNALGQLFLKRKIAVTHRLHDKHNVK